MNFETSSPFGPAVLLIYNAENLNEKGITEAADLLVRNYTHTARMTPSHKVDFIHYVRGQNKLGEPIRPIDVVLSSFFQSMTSTNPPSFHHECVKSYIIPEMLKAHSVIVKTIPDPQQDAIVKNWLACFVESFQSEDQLMRSYNFQGGIIPDPRVVQDKIAANLEKSVAQKRLTKRDVEAVYLTAKQALGCMPARSDNLSETLKFTGWYLTMFGMEMQHTVPFGEDALQRLDLMKLNLFNPAAYYYSPPPRNSHPYAMAPPPLPTNNSCQSYYQSAYYSPQ